MTARTAYTASGPSVFGIVAVTSFLVLVMVEFAITPVGGYRRKWLPPAPHASSTRPSQYDLVVSIRQDGSILIFNRFYSVPEFQSKMRELFYRAPAKHVVVEADRRLSFQQVRPVLSAISASGYWRLTLATATPDPLRGVGVLFGARAPLDAPQ